MARTLARTFGCDLQELFPRSTEPAPDWAWDPPESDPRYVLAEVKGRVWAFPLAQESTGTLVADGSGAPADETQEARHDPAKTLVLAGCDPSLGLLAPYLEQRGIRLIAYTRPNQAALDLLVHGRIHAAGLHCGTPDSRANTEFASRKLNEPFQLIRGTVWDLGLAVHPRIHVKSIRTLLLEDHRWINRPPGSGARECLRQLLTEQDVEQRPRGFDTQAPDHSAVAEIIQSGAAEVGISLPVCTSATDLSFLGLQQEAYDWCVREDMMADPRIQSLIQVLAESDYRKQLARIPGYDPETGGQRRSFTPSN